MTNVVSDLKHGFRVLLRTPLFTICTIAALAIGFGSTTALFSVVHALLVKPLPYKGADSLVVIWEHNLPRNRPRNVISPANFMAWRERSRSFDAMAAFTQNRVTLTGAGAALLLAALGVYGIVAYSVSQRSREFGIRVALGARPGQIINMVVGQNLRIVGLGLGVGLLIAIPATRLLRGLLYQVGPNDPTTFHRDRRIACGGGDGGVVLAGQTRHTSRSGRDAEG